MVSFIWRRGYIREEVETDFEKRSRSRNLFSNDCLPSSVPRVVPRSLTYKKKKEKISNEDEEENWRNVVLQR